MEKEFFTLIFFIAHFIAGLILLPIFLHKSQIKSKVYVNSQKIKDLMALNNEMQFHNVTKKFVIKKHYDNKSSYNKIEPVYLMSNELRSKIAYYTNYVNLLKENRSEFAIYNEKKNAILHKNYEVDYKTIRVRKNTFISNELVYFEKETIKPVLDCNFHVIMNYTSPKGKVDISKSQVFHLNDIIISLDSVARSTLDKTTQLHLREVERAELSDSLRYDILKRDNFKCVICGADAKSGARLHVDHIIPVSKGGKSVPSNLRTLCERCNVGKSAKIETETVKKLIPQNEKYNYCPLCGSQVVITANEYDVSYTCSSYPLCKFTKKIKSL